MAAAVNAAICAGEWAAGLRSGSLSLVMDGVHNLSDEFGLVLLYLAFFLPKEPSRVSVRLANLFNSAGLVVISGVLAFQAVARLRTPVAVAGTVPAVVGVLAAVANFAVARLLYRPSRSNAAIRLAYIHNLGDVLVSLAPAASGLLILAFKRPFFDPVCTLLIAAFFVIATLKEIRASREELIWPGRMTCGHEEPRGSLPA